jgi:biopolymer transport protein ExbB
MNLPPMTASRLLITFALALLPLTSHAWWNKDWTQRTRITLDTGATGIDTKEPVNNLPLAVRLHSGNFDFAKAKEDGSDLRVLAGDDKTPLAFRVERFDGLNELAVLWVLLPTVAPGSDKNVVYVYAGNTKAAAEGATATGLDTPVQAAFHFSGTDGADATGALKATAPLTPEVNGLLAGAAKLAGSAIEWPASDKLRTPAAGALTVSLWIKADSVNKATLWQQGSLALQLQDGKLAARIDKTPLSGGAVAVAQWTHVALTLGQGKAALYVNGLPVAQADAQTPLVEGPLRAGADFTGSLDELQIAGTVRAPAWLALAAGTQGVGAKGLVSVLESDAAQAEAGGHGYFGILFANLTTDAWIVIVILLVMFVIAVWVMVTKTVFVVRADQDNVRFQQRFRSATEDLLKLGQDAAAHPNSQLFRLYQAGVRELVKRRIGHPDAKPLSGASLDAVKASVDADMVRESARLNSQMVLLTIAISGGPFLGLLGTVVGVMITFAAIAAAGDVNVNAIAPGIAAALLATVAGLAVAIPALFGYNYLASRIKNISADMQIFVDEFITRVAELHGAP